MAKKIRLTKQQKRLLPLFLLILILVVSGAYALFIKKDSPVIPSHKAPVVASSAEKKDLPITTSGSSSPKTTSSGGTGATSSTDLVAPYGSFVSSHKPTIYSTEESICNTTYGASCYIEFTNGSVTKRLDAQTVGSDGVVSWTWQVSQAGLSSGTWQVSAVASLSGQTKTTKDQIPLEIQP